MNVPSAQKIQPPCKMIGDMRGRRPQAEHVSYVEVVRGTGSVESRGSMGGFIISVKTDEISNGWLNESAIIRFKAEYASVNLNVELEARGMSNIMVRHGSDRDAILTFQSKEELVLELKVIRSG
ncbi:hypothetical protein CsSME_00015263 [Camellia sinensis var. sinensis]